MFSRMIVLGLAAACGAQGQALTEQALLDLFDRQTPLRREAQATAAAAVEAVRGRTLWPNPVAIYSRETVGFTEFVLGEQQIPWSGRLRLERQALEPAREAAVADGTARIWDTRSSLRLAFYRALAAEQQAQVVREALAQADSIVELLRVREQEGEGSRYDRVRVERETVDLRTDAAQAAAIARTEMGVLSAYLPQGTSVTALRGDLAPRVITAQKDEVMRRAFDSRAEFRADTARLAQLTFEQQAAERLRIPEPVLTGGLKRTQVAPNLNDTGAAFGVSIPIPVFNKGRTEVARLQAEQDRIRARRDVLVQRITAVVSAAYDVYQARLEALNTFERETGSVGQDLLNTARVGYEEGEIGILELLDAYRIQRQTALRRLELQSALKEIEIELSRSAGYEVTQ